MDEIELKFLKKYIKNKKIYMVLGFDEKDQYNSITELNNIIKNISKELAQSSIIFYFGELPNKDKPDIGYVISEIKNKRDDIEIIMLTLNDEDKDNIELPIFVSKKLNIPVKTTKKRGVNNNNKKPLGLTKLWSDLNKIQQIEKLFILGGNNITLEEYNIAKDLELNIQYYPTKRKFLGDSKTSIKKNSKFEEKIGVTHILNIE
tara:strand:+ start:6983 stop:7594 length:612 start_codon:yes stop_codon:yes gene_type:complete